MPEFQHTTCKIFTTAKLETTFAMRVWPGLSGGRSCADLVIDEVASRQLQLAHVPVDSKVTALGIVEDEVEDHRLLAAWSAPCRARNGRLERWARE